MFSTITPINSFLTEFIQISKSYSEIIWYSKAEWNVRKQFFLKKFNKLWQCTPIIPATGRQKQKEQEFHAILGYIIKLRARLGFTRPCTKYEKKRIFQQYKNTSATNFVLGRIVAVCRSVVEYFPNKKEAMGLSPNITSQKSKPKASREELILYGTYIQLLSQ